MMERVSDSVRQFFVYAVFAGAATVVDMGLLSVLTAGAGLHYFWAAGLGYCAGMATNFSLNKVFTFNNTSTRVATQAGVFVAVALVGLVINQAVITALVEGTNAHVLIAKLIAVTVVAVWSFWGHKHFTFGLIHKENDHLTLRELVRKGISERARGEEREPVFERGSLFLLGATFVFALVVRYVATDFSAVATFTGDSYLYLLKAIEIAQGNWVPPYSHAIGTSLLFAPFVWLLEPISRFELMPYAQLFGVIVGALAVVPTWLIARQFLDRFSTALVTFTIAAHPWLIYYSTIFSSDGLFLVLSLMALYFCIRSLERPHHILYAVIFASISYYVRANGLFVLGVVVLTYLATHVRIRDHARSLVEHAGHVALASVGLIALFFALSAPFLIARHEAFGSAFTYGQNDKYFVEDFTMDVWTPNVPVPTLGEYLATHTSAEVFHKFVIDGFVKLVFSMVHGWEPNSFSSVILPVLLLPYIGGLFLCISTRRFIPVALFMGIFVAGLAPLYSVFAEGRYVVPIVPLVALVAFLGIRHAVGRHRYERTILATLTLAIVLWSLITPAMLLMKRADQSTLPAWAYVTAEKARGTLVSFDEGDYPMMLLPDTTVAGRNLSELKAPETGLEIIRYGKFDTLEEALAYHRDPRGTWLIISDRTVSLKPYLAELDDPRYKEAVPIIYDERGIVPGSTVRLHYVDWDKLSDLGKE